VGYRIAQTIDDSRRRLSDMGTLSPTLAVRDMKKTIEFYRNQLGFELGMCFPDANDPEYADLTKDEVVLMLIPAADLGISPEDKLGTGVNLYLQIDGDIDEYHDQLTQRGVKIAAEIKDEPFGIRDFTVEDINGYQITFNQLSKTAKMCMSCGMPLTKLEEFGGGNPANIYSASTAPTPMAASRATTRYGRGWSAS